MPTSYLEPISINNDAALVQATLAGDREAFGQIVKRYQALICSLAYSATGSLNQSEDLAQETFVAAWKSLARLAEPENLRAWLCGIARNLINNSLRRQGREPSHAAEPIEAIDETEASGPLPVEGAISNEEQAILWRSLEQIPDTYREPLILFYREHQSVESVAEKLALTPDAVHQRLSRGRKLLAEEVTAFVEGALAKTSPGKNFTLAVLASLPLMTATAKAATAGAALAKGGVAAKGVLVSGALGGFFIMLGGILVSLKAQVDDSKSPRERQFMLRHFGLRFCIASIIVVGFFALMRLGHFQSPMPFAWLGAGFGLVISINSAVTLSRFARRRRQIQIEDGTFLAAEWIAPRKTTEAAGGRFSQRSKQLQFMAIGIASAIYVSINQPWKTNPTHAVLWVLLMVLCLVRGFLSWGNAPKFRDYRSAIIYVPIGAWLATLVFFGWGQYVAGISGVSAKIASTGTVVLFNLVVSCGYIALLAILVINRRRPVSN